MPDDDPSHTSTSPPPKQPPPHSRPAFRDLFAIPPPLKHLFDRTPLLTYPANTLPARSPSERTVHRLYLFTHLDDARHGRPSFNPACLKWQAYLKFAGVDFTPMPSNNHASPSGALPFLLPAATTSTAAAEPAPPVPSAKLRRWIAAQKRDWKESQVHDTGADPRYDAYASLLDHPLRRAWLHQLYLLPPNHPLLHRLYISPTSSNPLVQLTLLHQLRQAATTQLLLSNPASSPPDIISGPEILADAQEAIAALSSLLGEDEWFFGAMRPGEMDAGLFAYTELLLGMEWGEGGNGLGEVVQGHGNLVRHRERVRERYF